MARQFSSGWAVYSSAFNGTVTQLPVTVSAWFKADNTSGYQRVVMWSRSDAYDCCASILLNYPSAGQLSNQFYGPNYLPTAAGTFSTGVWNHGCVVTGSSAARSYLNGSVGSDSPTYTPASYAFSNNSYFQIGMNYVQGVQGFAGRIAEVAAWSAELTAAEVAALAAGHSPLTIRPGSLIAYYPLGGHYGQRDIDAWKSKYDLSVYGSPTWDDHCRVIYPAAQIQLKTGTSTINGVLAGVASLALSAAAPITGKGVVAGSSALALSTSSTITGKGVISGTVGVTFNTTAAATGQGVIAGSGTVSIGTSAVIAGAGVISGSSTIALSSSGSISSPTLIVGSAGMSLASTGSITGLGVVVGVSGLSLSGSAAVVGIGFAAGTTSITLSATGSIGAPVAIAGTAAISLNAAGAIVGAGVILAAGAVSINGSADVMGIGVIAGTDGIALTAAGEIAGVVNLTGAAVVSLSIEGDIFAVGVVSGQSSFTLEANGAIAGIVYAQGEASLVFNASGTILVASERLLICATGVSMLPQFLIRGSLGPEFTLHSEGTGAPFTIVWGEDSMTCQCDCEDIKFILTNTTNTHQLILTNATTAAVTNSPTLAWTLKSRNGVTTIGSGTCSNSGASGVYTIEIPLSVVSQCTPGERYLLILSVAASNFYKQYEPLAKVN